MRSRKVVRLSLVRNEVRASEAKYMRGSLFQSARNASNSFGSELSGFVTVSWDRKGNVRTAVNSGYGPVPWATLSEFCRDAIQRHLAVDLAQSCAGQRIEPEDEGA